jgi:hypothetical protein
MFSFHFNTVDPHTVQQHLFDASFDSSAKAVLFALTLMPRLPDAITAVGLQDHDRVVWLGAWRYQPNAGAVWVDESAG